MINEIAYKDKEEWLLLRKELGVGGSEAGSVVGLNPYKSAYTLFMEKTGKVPEFEGNLTTEVGSYLEEFVAKLFEKETGKKLRRKNRILVNTRYPFAFGDVDRIVVGENSVVEIKTTNSLPAMRKFKKGEYPEQWYCQMTHYLAVGGFDKAYLAVLIGCREFKVFELERDEEEIEALMYAEEKFWENVKSNTPPMVDGTESTTKTLGTVFSTSNSDSVSLHAYDTILRQYTALGEQIEALEAQKEELANKVKAFLGESGGGESDRYKVSWTSSKRSTFDSKRFAKDHADINLSEYYKYTNVRTFKVSEKG